MTTPGMRASDTDRQMVVDRLAQHFAEGRLTMSEYDERVSKAYGAVYRDDFNVLFADLPSGRGGYAGPEADQRERNPFAGTPFDKIPFDRIPFGGSSVGRPFRGGLRSAGRPHPAVVVLGVIATFMLIGVLVHLFWPLLVLAAVIFFVGRGRRERRNAQWSRPDDRDWAGR
ncbi:DUF1707 SHOCT-like domain-containing protein [Nakamurella lactea]|uniref:DUF1707 SHOCT-like domain-containing protein n=1 Tax=Nakamurella lactea TaxID=459515 RepID=UPI00040789CB|nr:DUF1707 domain-containing protein [Nakamurella lactea]